MSSYINTNVASLNAQNNLANSQGGLSQALERLSSGLRINSAADDAAGLAISTRMSSQINGLTQAARNANDGISLAQTAGGALTSVNANLQTLRQLAVESANATNTSSDRKALNAEAQQLVSEIQNTATTTQFNGQNLLDGSFTAQQFQTGANANQTITVSVAGATTSTLGNFGGAGTSAVTSTAWSVADSIIINGVTIGASNSTSAPGVSAGSAYAKSAAINAQASLTGVTATASTTVSGAAATPGSSTTSGELWINGIAVGSISSSTSALGQIQNSANAINAVSAQSGVTAIANASTGQLQLTASDGRDINVSTNAGTGAADVLAATGLTATAFAGTTVAANGNLDPTVANTGGSTTTGTLSLNSSSAINLTDTDAGVALGYGGLTGYSSKLSSLATLDITSVSGANSAINIIDASINQINAQQADLGAIQNRFTSTIGNLNTSSTNLSAARSRIQDTDYASETANLAHYQILQQAGTAMLAQANSLPNSILTLLR
ncbi:MAG TPA: flagellin [Burkholderiaceae bacterium]|jgi:flagellin